MKDFLGQRDAPLQGDWASAQELQVKTLLIDTLNPYAANARTHSEKQVQQIAESIGVFGFVNPILIDERDTVISGHGRLEAAKRLGLKTVPTITITHLSEPQKRALRLADNKIAENAGWDQNNLALELSLDAARSKCEAYRRKYNEERPHSAIGNKTPLEFIKAIGQPSHPMV